MTFPFTFPRRAPVTLHEQRVKAWAKCPGDGLPDEPKITQPVETRKQWKTVERFKRKAS